LTKLT